MDQWEATTGSMKDGSSEIGCDIDDQSMKSTFGHMREKEEFGSTTSFPSQARCAKTRRAKTRLRAKAREKKWKSKRKVNKVLEKVKTKSVKT